MKESQDSPSTFRWIPQLFYDLIGCVIPGAAVLASGRLLLLEPGTFQPLIGPRGRASLLIKTFAA
jgi:hypothetical protein